MTAFPDKTKMKTELQETTTEMNLSCDHLTTCNFMELNVAYVRDNTTKEDWQCDAGVFARPMPLQMPVMGKADLKLKTYYVPYRNISPQWDAFITRAPYVPANGSVSIIVNEMPYFKAKVFSDLLADTEVATTTTTNEDYEINGTKYILTTFGRYLNKILNQLGYQFILDTKSEKHIDAKRLLCIAKIYLDWYYTSQYAGVSADYVAIEKLLKTDNNTALELTKNDIKDIIKFIRYVYYDTDYFTAAWDNPNNPNGVNTSFGTITMEDITLYGTNYQAVQVDNIANANTNQGGTPNINTAGNGAPTRLTQYAIDSLKKVTDYCRRYQIAGVRAIDRYLSRFGVLLTIEKLQRSQFIGKQETPMNFGAIYSTAETQQGSLGDYGGTGIINSDQGEHNTFELNNLDEYGCILMLFNINPKVGYYQGMDRENLVSDPESYFSGIFDQLGTQATSAAELYISTNDAGGLAGDQQIDKIWGYMPRQAHYKIAHDRLTGDFRRTSLFAMADCWHMYRTFNDQFFAQIGDIHNSQFIRGIDSAQYLRIFNSQNEEDGDHFNVIFQFKVTVKMHAKPLYDTYDFDSEGKSIIMDGQGSKQN